MLRLFFCFVTTFCLIIAKGQNLSYLKLISNNNDLEFNGNRLPLNFKTEIIFLDSILSIERYTPMGKEKENWTAKKVELSPDFETTSFGTIFFTLTTKDKKTNTTVSGSLELKVSLAVGGKKTYSCNGSFGGGIKNGEMGKFIFEVLENSCIIKFTKNEI